MKKICATCGKEFEAAKNRKYCSNKCALKMQNSGYFRKKKKTVCKKCGKLFIADARHKVYCSDACQKGQYKIYDKECPVCGVTFKATGCKIYCSVKCREKRGNERAREDTCAVKPQNRPKKRVSMINEINAQARANGMSYGQFKALQYMQEHKANIL